LSQSIIELINQKHHLAKHKFFRTSRNLSPATSNPSLQQYDNYQIHDLYCEDIIYEDLIINNITIPHPNPVEFRTFLAVERVSVHGEIEINFEAIALAYP
jgi:hypothetical protein